MSNENHKKLNTGFITKPSPGMTSFILNVNWDAELKLDKYDANLSAQK